MNLRLKPRYEDRHIGYETGTASTYRLHYAKTLCRSFTGTIIA